LKECIICNKLTDNYINWKNEDETECTPQYVCEECMWESIHKEQAEYKIKYDKAVKYLKENNYTVIVESYNDNEEKITEEFEIKEDIMECVDIIRERMEEQGYNETWIDVHWEIYEDCELEIVDYLCFNKGREKEKAFWIELINNENKI
jgi:hypothetical protein